MSFAVLPYPARNPTHLLIAALFTVGERAAIEGKNLGQDDMEVKRIEGEIEQKHLRFSAVAIAPELLLADHSTRNGIAIDEVDLMQTDRANELIAIDGHDSHGNILLILALVFDPFVLFAGSDGEDAHEELRDFLIIHPFLKRLGI